MKVGEITERTGKENNSGDVRRMFCRGGGCLPENDLLWAVEGINVSFCHPDDGSRPDDKIVQRLVYIFRHFFISDSNRRFYPRFTKEIKVTCR